MNNILSRDAMKKWIEDYWNAFNKSLDEQTKDVFEEAMTRQLPADVARCEGRPETHPYYAECLQCRRKTAPLTDHPWQSWIRGWAGHGECPDKLEEKEE